MKYEMEVYMALCSLRKFVINGISADESDFVDKYDHNSEEAEPYGCGNMKADIKPSSKDVLKKYGITQEQYENIAEEVSEKVSFGSCGWCV